MFADLPFFVDWIVVGFGVVLRFRVLLGCLFCVVVNALDSCLCCYGCGFAFWVVVLIIPLDALWFCVFVCFCLWGWTYAGCRGFGLCVWVVLGLELLAVTST